MSLKKLKVAQAEIVKTSGGELPVRGLSLSDITLLVERHRLVVEDMFAKYKSGTAKVEDFDEQSFAAVLLKEAPGLVAEVICVASDSELDEESINIAKKLSLPEQIEAIHKIGSATFKSEQDLGNVVSVVIQMFNGATKALTNLRV